MAQPILFILIRQFFKRPVLTIIPRAIMLKVARRYFGSLKFLKRYFFVAPPCVGYNRLLGIKQFCASMGTGASHMQMIPPLPRAREALSNTANFFTSRTSGLAERLTS
ncbi:MAG TPA: hypothetical protein PKX46_09400, partial [Clostridia bacterium]|nr:hypothetical protein [Clostridia bacterium]